MGLYVVLIPRQRFISISRGKLPDIKRGNRFQRPCVNTFVIIILHQEGDRNSRIASLFASVSEKLLYLVTGDG
jgi:hypothetical protein